MGCYWNAYADMKIDSIETGNNIKSYINSLKKENDCYDYGYDIDISKDWISIQYNDHATYSFYDYFESMINNVAEKFGLTGEMSIRSEEDASEPPTKFNYTNGKAECLEPLVIYHKSGERLFYYITEGPHGLVWATDVKAAQEKVKTHILKKRGGSLPDDEDWPYIYPLNDDIDAELQELDS